MQKALQQVLDLLNLETIDPLVFVGKSQDLGFFQLFGGQALGQSVVATSRTVDPNKVIHSLHAYFLRPGDPNQPVYYEVEAIRGGSSFWTRRVTAKQGGLAIFAMSASFHSQETGPEHQFPLPDVAGPDGLVNEVEHIRRIKAHLPEDRRDKLTADRAIEIRIVDRDDARVPSQRPPIKYAWFRAIDAMPDSPLLHASLLAYASDFGLSTTSLLPHALSLAHPNVRLASLDHSMWFHRPCRLDDWLLYAMDSPCAVGARSFNRGQIFTRDGVLVASVAQEALLRNNFKARKS